MMINIILAVGLNIVKGFCGQVTVGHIALAAIGAYSSAVLTVNFGFPFWIALPCAMLIAGFAGIVVGVPSFRLEGAYLALATLGLAEAVRIFISATNYLGAAEGFGNIPAPRIGAFVMDDHIAYYYVTMPLALLGIFISFSILRSRRRPRVPRGARGRDGGRRGRHQRAQVQAARLRHQRALRRLRRQPDGPPGAGLPAPQQLHDRRDGDRAC